MDPFGFDMEDMEKLRTKQETSGRDLPSGMDKAWYWTQISLKNRDGVGHSKNPNGVGNKMISKSRLSQMTTTKM